MNKKNYTAPEITVVNVETESLMAASPIGNSVDNVTPASTGEYGLGKTHDSFDLWADDEEF